MNMTSIPRYYKIQVHDCHDCMRVEFRRPNRTHENKVEDFRCNRKTTCTTTLPRAQSQIRRDARAQQRGVFVAFLNSTSISEDSIDQSRQCDAALLACLLR